MQRARTVEEFVGAPIDRWVVAAPTALAFCVDAHLGGAVVWGQPTPSDTERVLRAYEPYERLASPLDLVLDCSALTNVDGDAVTSVLRWVSQRRADLSARIGVQYGVVPSSLLGITLAGILPTVGDTHRYRVVHEARAAHRAVSSRGDAIHEELLRIVASVREVPRELRELRDLLRRPAAPRTVGAAARALSLSARSLQRTLAMHGTSFRVESRAAMFERVEALLRHGKDKIEVVALRLGISVSTLGQLVRERTGQSPQHIRRSGAKWGEASAASMGGRDPRAL